MKTRMLLSLLAFGIIAFGQLLIGRSYGASVTLSNGASCTATQVVVTCAGAQPPPS
jgi:hypothetical protein